MDIKHFQRKVAALPTISAVANQINLAVKNESLTTTALGEIISRDPALTTKVLKLANSAYYGLMREVDTLPRAITVLGFETIKNLALTVSVFHAFCTREGRQIDLKGLWHHSLGTAVAAKAICARSLPLIRDETMMEEAFLCGIIHDMGKIALTQCLPSEMAQVFERMRETGRPQYEIEKEIIGFSHQRAGQALADVWNFPEEYLKVIKQHHTPKVAATTAPRTAHLIRVVYIGNKITKAMHLGESTDPLIVKLTPEDLKPLGISNKILTEIINTIKTDYHTLLEQWTYES